MLTRQLTAEDVSRGLYFCIFAHDMLGCVRIQKVSWWGYEVKHLTVDPDHRRAGIGIMLLKMAERAIQNRNRHIMLATTRADNVAVIKLNQKFGMTCVHSFINPTSKRKVLIWIKKV